MQILNESWIHAHCGGAEVKLHQHADLTPYDRLCIFRWKSCDFYTNYFTFFWAQLKNPLSMFPGSPAEGRPGLAGLSGQRRGSVLAAGTLLRADVPWCHTRRGQSDDTLRSWGGRPAARGLLVGLEAAWTLITADMWRKTLHHHAAQKLSCNKDFWVFLGIKTQNKYFQMYKQELSVLLHFFFIILQ